MAKFIALRRQPHSERLGLTTLAFEERRSEILKEAPGVEQSEALRGLGLTQVKPEERTLDVRSTFQELGYVGAYVVDTPSEGVAEQAKQALEPEYLVMPNIDLALPTPTLSETHSRRPRQRQYWPDESGVAKAHKDGITGRDVLVGVLDTGCDADHLELQKKRVDFRYVPLDPRPDAMRACRGFDTAGHGTHVCGIIAGQNVGVAPDVDLMVASVIESETLKTSLERVVIALNWMLSQFGVEENLSKPTIINMSLGFLPEWVSGPHYQSVVDGMKLIISTLVTDFDVLPVVAIGNDGHGKIRLPGFFPEVLSVGAVDFNLQLADFSGGGLSPITGDPKPDIAGYGVDVLSSLERDMDKHSLYARMSGTSMATPYVTGIAALVAAANPGLAGTALRRRLIDDARHLPALANRVGAGLARYA